MSTNEERIRQLNAKANERRTRSLVLATDSRNCQQCGVTCQTGKIYERVDSFVRLCDECGRDELYERAKRSNDRRSQAVSFLSRIDTGQVPRARDIHRSTAAIVFGVAPELVTEDQRRASKTINFGILYGTRWPPRSQAMSPIPRCANCGRRISLNADLDIRGVAPYWHHTDLVDVDSAGVACLSRDPSDDSIATPGPSDFVTVTYQPYVRITDGRNYDYAITTSTGEVVERYAYPDTARMRADELNRNEV